MEPKEDWGRGISAPLRPKAQTKGPGPGRVPLLVPLYPCPYPYPGLSRYRPAYLPTNVPTAILAKMLTKTLAKPLADTLAKILANTLANTLAKTLAKILAKILATNAVAVGFLSEASLMTTTSSSRRFEPVLGVIDKMTMICSTIAVICLLAILVLILSEIFLRNVANYSLHFSWDLSGYLMGACFMFGSASAMRAGTHVRVTALLEILPAGLARILVPLACLIGIGICAYLTAALAQMAWLSAVRGSTAATSFRAPLVYPQGALALGAALLTLQCFAQLLRVLRGEPLATGPGIE